MPVISAAPFSYHEGHEGHKGIQLKGVPRVAPEDSGSYAVHGELFAINIKPVIPW